MQVISLTAMSNLTPGMSLMIEQKQLDLMQVVQLLPIPEKGSTDRLPESIAVLIDNVLVGMTRLELMMKASRKGFNPVWHVAESPYEGLLTLYFNDKQWRLYCKLQPVELH